MHQQDWWTTLILYCSSKIYRVGHGFLRQAQDRLARDRVISNMACNKKLYYLILRFLNGALCLPAMESYKHFVT